MPTISDRISEVVAVSGLTKTGFGKEINLTQSMVSKLCSGAATPSDRTISDICRVFYVNESWLTRGEGEMINYAAKEDTILGYFSESSHIDLETRKRLAKAISKIPDYLYPKLEVALTEVLDNFIKAEPIKQSDNKETPPENPEA